MRADTFGNEAELPRIPLPAVEDSCARFLEWCGPLLSADELAATQDAVSSLTSDGTARQLQAALAAYEADNGVHSWLDEFWRDRYLGRRDRIALNANFFFLFNDTGDDQISRAVRLIAAAVDYKLALDAQTVAPVVRRGKPQSMEQNRYLFGTTRIPGIARDTVRVPQAGADGTRHIVVFVRGNMFRVDVIGPDKIPHTRDELAQALREVAAAGPARGQSVGSLTTKARAEWARSRTALLAAHPDNEAALDVVETALFCVSLEDEAPADTGDKCKRLLAGDPGNRWFDKAVTLIVFPDGSAGLNSEHCVLDGTTIVEFTDALLTGSAQEHPRNSGAAPQGTPGFRPIEFMLTGELVSDVATADKEFTRYADDTATRAVSYPGSGSDRIKSLGISPDAFVQLAFQLAHRRSKGFTGATYESIATRHFHHGRTEAMRVVTPEILEFVSAMDDPALGGRARAAALRRAAGKHVARARECQAGDAPEQHLWELQLLAKRLGWAWSAPLYTSPGWLRMRDDYLSTSAAPSVNIQYFGFGATSEHCIGVAYVLQPERFNVHLSTPRSVGEQMTVFADRLGEAITEMSDLLAGE